MVEVADEGVIARVLAGFADFEATFGFGDGDGLFAGDNRLPMTAEVLY